MSFWLFSQSHLFWPFNRPAPSTARRCAGALTITGSAIINGPPTLPQQQQAVARDAVTFFIFFCRRFTIGEKGKIGERV